MRKKKQNTPHYPAILLAARGLQAVCALLFVALTLLLYTENADFQAKIAFLHASDELVGFGAVILLVAGFCSVMLQERL